MKKCSMCLNSKPSTKEFFHSDKGKKDGMSSRCKYCSKMAKRKWVENNWDRHVEYHANYRKVNRDKILRANREWISNNKEKKRRLDVAYKRKNREKVNANSRRRYKESPKEKVNFSISSRVRRSLGGESSGVFKHLPYSKQELCDHLERQFLKGMEWDNYGEWHIDHIIPISSFEYTSTKDESFQQCWSLANLRPLWAKENLEKRDKITHLI